MISLEKWTILTTIQKLPKNVGDLDKLIAAKGFKKLPKVQKIAQSGHTAPWWYHAVSSGKGGQAVCVWQLAQGQCDQMAKLCFQY